MSVCVCFTLKTKTSVPLVANKIVFNVDFAVPENHLVKIVESEKSDKTIDLAGELRMIWNKWVTVILIIGKET